MSDDNQTETETETFDQEAQAEEWDPREDPFACSRCAAYLGDLDRAQGHDYCSGCRRESAATPRDERRPRRRGGRRD